MIVRMSYKPMTIVKVALQKKLIQPWISRLSHRVTEKVRCPLYSMKKIPEMGRFWVSKNNFSDELQADESRESNFKQNLIQLWISRHSDRVTRKVRCPLYSTEKKTQHSMVLGIEK